MSSHARSLPPVVLVAIMSVVSLTFAGIMLFARGRAMMEDQIKEKLRNTATAAAMQFNGNLIDQVTSNSTMENSVVLQDLVRRLDALRQEVASVRFAYIMERTSDPTHHAFVADADMALSVEELDEDKNGVLDESEMPAKPGDLYDWQQFPKLGEEAFMHPTVDDHIGEDRWGPIISGYAPIRRDNGQVVGILGIDMDAHEFTKLSTSIFSPIALLLVILASISIACGTVLAFRRRRIEELEKLETERLGLLRLAFHQLGGPLTIISWSIEELENDGPASIQRAVENIHEGINRLSVILNTLKEADMVHAGKLEYKPEKRLLSTILREVVSNSTNKLHSRKQRIEFDIEEDITLNLDPKLMSSVVQELMNNAMDFSPDGAVIHIASSANLQYATFTVRDDGCGIPKKDLRSIFDEFSRGSNAPKYKANGNGLGLYIVQGIVQCAGGSVSIQNNKDVGVTATVKLPLAGKEAILTAL